MVFNKNNQPYFPKYSMFLLFFYKDSIFLYIFFKTCNLFECIFIKIL